MTVFRTFLKIFKKNKFIILMYTAILIVFSVSNMQTDQTSTSFIAEKPDIYIINHDQENKLTKNLVTYMKKNSSVIKLENSEEKQDDAIFYRDVNYLIEIPENYGVDFIQGKNPTIKVKSTKDYQASLAELLLTRYLKIANTYQKSVTDEDELISYINKTLSKRANISITSKIDTNQLAKASFYYNFMNYSILAGCVYVICLILSSFKEEKIKKRTIISSMSYQKHNRILLLSNLLLAIVLWLFYVLLSFVLLKDIMFTKYGLIYILNSFVFNLNALTLAFLIGNLIKNKNAINGIINVVGLGTSFLCGAFVPMEMLPDSVLKIAHVLPSYWYIKSNELLKEIETINLSSLQPIIMNLLVITGFSILFIVITNIISRKTRKIG